MFCYEQNDETLVMLTMAGEQAAYEVLVTRWQKAVLAAAMSVLHSHHMAEDAAQDAFITAWMKLDCLKEPEKFGAWVCRIARNCAKNTILRYRSWLPAEAADSADAYLSSGNPDFDPEERFLIAEENAILRDSVGRLPGRVGDIIRMHYFEDLSVGEIARRLGIAEGTVKWQLSDGRKRIRKELCAMNEQYNDNLTQRVMKKVEELKNWQYDNAKTGFEEVYRDVLAAVEGLPESDEAKETGKYHAMADVLMRGRWWIAGDDELRGDEMLARIREAAERGHNDDVMAYLCTEETRKLWGDARVDYIRETLIPRFEAGNYPKALTHAWYQLGETLLMNEDGKIGGELLAHANEALEKAVAVSGDSGKNLYTAAAEAALARNAAILCDCTDRKQRSFRLTAGAEEYRVLDTDGAFRRFDNNWWQCGRLCSADLDADFVLRNASTCDGYFTYPGLGVGETHIGSDGTRLTYADDDATVTTPAGTFEGCRVWEIVRTDDAAGLYRTWYKENVGIVRQEHHYDGVTETRVLSSYAVTGRGLVPLVRGNTWEYRAEPENPHVRKGGRYTVSSGENGTALVSLTAALIRDGYDENSWLDMIEYIRGEYFDGEHVCDVTHAIERAETLAVTPIEKAHTAAAASVAKRIMETDPTFNPDYRATGHWNFFARSNLHTADDGSRRTMSHHFRWSFELKNVGGGETEPLLSNDILDILGDALGCVFDEAWKPGYRDTVHRMPQYKTPLCTEVVCEDAGEVTVRAGTFAGCMRMKLNISGYPDGLAYRGGNREYLFAPGIGIIRAENEACGGARKVVYELSAYEGTGEGWNPLDPGMMRTYEALDLTDGYIAGTVYTFAADADGNTVIFSDRTGIKEKLQRITDYAVIDGETVEERLWNEGKHDESRLRHAVNNFRLFAHFHGRPSRYWAAPDKAIAWNRYRMQMLENLNEDGSVPDAWKGHYAATAFRLACALFGCGKNDEGWEALDRAFPAMEAWLSIPAGCDMDTGNPLIWGGIKVRKGKDLLVLPDGTVEPLYYEYLFSENQNLMHYGLTAAHGWEWFDGVRNEERYKDAIERAKKLTKIR